MFFPRLLVTSFRPWKAHQTSNSSDDLLRSLDHQGRLPAHCLWIDQVPVHFDLAPMVVLNAIHQYRPAIVVCCGMAEQRHHLNLELYGKATNHQLASSLAMDSLLQGTCWTEVSTDAGNYVCNHLYYRVLQHLQKSFKQEQALFVHIPCLTPVNQLWIEKDFLQLLQNLTAAVR